MTDATDFFSRKVEELKRHNEQLEAQFQAEQFDDYESPRSDHESEDSQGAEEVDQAFDEDFEEARRWPNEDDEVLAQATEVQELTEGLAEAKSIIKFQKARIEALQDELGEAVSTINAQALQIDNLQGSSSAASEDTRKQSQQVIVLTQSLEKTKKQLAEATKKVAEQERAIAELNKELAQAKRTQKKTEQDASTREVRLNRLIEEVERYKTQLREVKSSEGETQDRSKKEFDRILQDNKRLERQKSELFTAFKKQLKLIDILKRQKLHIEAARVLEFSEEEFMRTLDLGEKL